MPLAERMGLFVCTTLMTPTSKRGHTVMWRLLIETGVFAVLMRYNLNTTATFLATKEQLHNHTDMIE